MKTISYVALLAFLTFCSGYLLPQWWIIAFVSFVVAIAFRQGMLRSGLLSFLTVGMVWLISAFVIDGANDSILSQRVGDLFGVGSSGILIVTAVLGGTIALLAALTGASLRQVIDDNS